MSSPDSRSMMSTLLRGTSGLVGTFLRGLGDLLLNLLRGLHDIVVAALTAEIEVSLFDKTVMIKARNGLAIIATVIIVWLVFHP